MNLQGVVNTHRSERYFWAVCGSIGLFLVLFILPIAFRHEIRHLLGKTAPHNDDENDNDYNEENKVMMGSRWREKGNNNNDDRRKSVGWLMRRIWQAYLGIDPNEAGGSSSPEEKFGNDYRV